MVNQLQLLEKKGTVAAKSDLRPTQSLPAKAKQSDIDDILEDTLINIEPVGSLTKRETEILQMIVAGKTNKKIAQSLYRAERTVEYHRNRIMRKLGTRTAADLVKRAIDMGLT